MHALIALFTLMAAPWGVCISYANGCQFRHHVRGDVVTSAEVHCGDGWVDLDAGGAYGGCPGTFLPGY